MEEIVTVDGRQYKLTYDRPLTAEQKVQTIADIRKQSGCGTCGQPKIANMGNNWQYGGIKSMAACAAGAKGSGPGDDPVHLVATPNGGVAPYTVTFFMKRNTEDYFQINTGNGTPAIGTVTGTNPQTVATDNTATTVFSYKLIDSDIANASGDAAAGIPTTDGTGAIADPGDAGAALGAGKIRFATTTIDSCPSPIGPAYCIEWCDVTVTCPSPSCNFVVT